MGRSCILVSIAGKNVMLDCGMHMGYNDDVSRAESVSGCICLAFPSRTLGLCSASFPFVSALPGCSSVVGGIALNWVLLGACVSCCWSWGMAGSKLLLLLHSLALLCRRCIPLSIPGL